MSLVGKKAPYFRANAVINGKRIVEDFSLDQYLGKKHVVFFFYPKDFTFVCPTELHAYQEKLAEFEKRNCAVVACSTDTEESHWGWLQMPKNKGGIEGITYPIIADTAKTISSNFGTLDSCRYNLENLLSAGVTNQVFSKEQNELSLDEKNILDQLAGLGYEKYLSFKNHPQFIPYLEQMSTLKYYAKTNIGSRPSKRSKSEHLNFADLRAIPFVGSWSQLKQNVPGFFGVGTALKYFEDTNQWNKVQDLYDNSFEL